MTPTAKSLILDLLSTARGHTMPVRALVRAGKAGPVIAAGRSEFRGADGLQWKGFLRRFALEKGALLPSGPPLLFEI